MMDAKKEIAGIKKRNRAVEADKAWETSAVRKALVALLTYAAVAVYFIYAGIPNPLANAVVPALAFVLSTLSVPVAKKWWVKNVYRGR